MFLRLTETAVYCFSFPPSLTELPDCNGQFQVDLLLLLLVYDAVHVIKMFVAYQASVNASGDSDLQSLLSNMNQQQLMQLLGNASLRVLCKRKGDKGKGASMGSVPAGIEAVSDLPFPGPALRRRWPVTLSPRYLQPHHSCVGWEHCGDGIFYNLALAWN